MTEEQARRLWDYTTTALGDNRSHMRQLGNGEWVVILQKDCYHLWNFEQWNAFYRGQKKARRRERKASTGREQVGIDPEVSYHLAFA